MEAIGTIGVSDYAAQHHDPTKSNRGTLFLKRRPPSIGEDRFHSAPDWPWLVAQVENNWTKQKPGYREGVILVPVPVEGFLREGGRGSLFTCPIAELVEGDVFRGAYERRRPTETPRRRVAVIRDTMPAAKFVDVVLYRGDVLDEDTENPRVTDCDWEIVTLLGKLTDEDQPMPTDTLMANHFLSDGGTSINMSDAEFIAALKKSFEYWSNKSIVEIP